MNIYSNLTSRDIFNYLIYVNIGGFAYMFFFWGIEYILDIFYVNLFIIIFVAYLYFDKNIRGIRWFWYLYALFTLSAVFLTSPAEAWRLNGFYYPLFNIPEILLTAASLHKLLIEN